MSYAAFPAMVAPARVRPALWRLVLGVLTIVALSFAWMFLTIPLASFMTAADGPAEVFQLIVGEPPGSAGVILMLVLIAGLAPATFVAARFWNKRSVASLFGRGPKTLRHFIASAATTLVVLALFQLAFLPFDDPPSRSMDLNVWLTWLPFGLLGLLAQTGAEEVMFRGYIQTQLAARFRSPLIWLILPSALFAALHYTPGLSQVLTIYILIGTFVFGVLAADLTARTGSLGAAWGFHFANNALAILIISYDSTFAGLNLFQAATPMDTITGFSPVFLLDFLAIVAVWLAIRRVLAI